MGLYGIFLTDKEITNKFPCDPSQVGKWGLRKNHNDAFQDKIDL